MIIVQFQELCLKRGYGGDSGFWSDTTLDRPKGAA
jgi:hypothetical protein